MSQVIDLKYLEINNYQRNNLQPPYFEFKLKEKKVDNWIYILIAIQLSTHSHRQNELQPKLICRATCANSRDYRSSRDM